jgi:hypothetical protein
VSASPSSSCSAATRSSPRGQAPTCTAIPRDRLLSWLVLLGPRNVIHGHRAPRPAPRGRGTAQNRPQTPPGLGRPSPIRRADPTPTRELARSSPRHPGHGLTVVPLVGDQEVDLPEPWRSPTPPDTIATRASTRVAWSHPTSMARRDPPELGVGLEPAGPPNLVTVMVSRTLISAVAASRPRSHGSQAAQHDRSPWHFDSPISWL